MTKKSRFLLISPSHFEPHRPSKWFFCQISLGIDQTVSNWRLTTILYYLISKSLKGHFLKIAIFAILALLGPHKGNVRKMSENHDFFGFFKNVSKCHKMIPVMFWDVLGSLDAIWGPKMIFWSHGSHLWHHDLASLNNDKISIIMEFRGGREKLVRIVGVNNTPPWC